MMFPSSKMNTLVSEVMRADKHENHMLTYFFPLLNRWKEEYVGPRPSATPGKSILTDCV